MGVLQPCCRTGGAGRGARRGGTLLLLLLLGGLWRFGRGGLRLRSRSGLRLGLRGCGGFSRSGWLGGGRAGLRSRLGFLVAGGEGGAGGEEDAESFHGVLTLERLAENRLEDRSPQALPRVVEEGKSKVPSLVGNFPKRPREKGERVVRLRRPTERT